MAKLVYLPRRFMTVNQAVDKLLEVESKRQENVARPEDYAVGMARLGQSTQKIVFGTLEQLRNAMWTSARLCIAWP